jgi:hypothetical protein
MLLVSEARASIRALQTGNNLCYLFQKTLYDDAHVPGRPTEECNHRESDRRKTGYLVISSVLFGLKL